MKTAAALEHPATLQASRYRQRRPHPPGL